MTVTKKTKLLLRDRVFPCIASDNANFVWNWESVCEFVTTAAENNFLRFETRVLEGIARLVPRIVNVTFTYAKQAVMKGAIDLQGYKATVLPESARNLASGEILVLCFRIETLEVNNECHARGVIGFLPWFCHRVAILKNGELNLDRILQNTCGSPSSNDQTICQRLSTVRKPLFLLHTEESAADITASAPLPAVLSFALMWQMMRKQKKRPEEHRFILSQRSYKYFGKQCPRIALFASKAGFLSIRHTLSFILDRDICQFLTAQICDAFACLMSAECQTDICLLLHLQSVLVPLSCALAHLQNIKTDKFIEVDFIDHFVSDTELSPADAEFLSNSMTEAICLSFDFGAGGIVADALISIGDRQWRDIAIFKNGRVYISDKKAHVSIATEVLREYLSRTSASEPVGASGDWVEKFRKALPNVRGVYEETRDTTFDDVYLNTLLHSTAAPHVNLSEFRSFSIGTSARITIPPLVNVPEFYGICESQIKNTDPFFYEGMRLALHAIAASDAVNAQVPYGVESDQACQRRLKELARPPIDKSKLMRNAVADIEDTVQIIHEKRALPLCLEKYYQRIVNDTTHLKNQERISYYKLLDSLEIEELDNLTIARHMTRATSSNLRAEQLRDIIGFEDMSSKAHSNNAKRQRTYLLASNGSNMSQEEALEITTPALACNVMIKLKQCPFAAQSTTNLKLLLVRAGVDEARATAIAAEGHTEKKACLLHLHAVTTPDVKSPWPIRQPAQSENPRDFTRYAASVFLHNRKKQPTVNDE
jgi:hypothetical protein